MPYNSTFKIFDGTNWIDPCNCVINFRKSDNIFEELTPTTCETRYWNGCSWVLLECECICPEGYNYSAVTGDCEKIEIVPASADPTTVYHLKNGNNATSYSSWGTRLYDDVSNKIYPINGYQACNGCSPCNTGSICSLSNYQFYDNNGVGALLPILNTSQSVVFKSTNAVNGRLNIAGIWAETASHVPYPDQTWLSFKACIDITEEQTYMFAIAGDNSVRASINSTTFNGGGFTNLVNVRYASTPNGTMELINPNLTIVPFIIWHIFPITLPAGNHTIILEGWNHSSLASFAAEIYKMNIQDMISLMNNPSAVPSDLDPYIVFTTASYKNTGQDFPIALDGETVEWSCPDGYTFTECYGFPSCIIKSNVSCEE